MNKSIGGKNKYMRQRKNLSQYALATKAGVAQSTLSYIEKGARQPRSETLQALCTAPDITMLELSTCSEDASPERFFREENPGPVLSLAHANSSGIRFRWLSAKRSCPPSMHCQFVKARV